MSQDSPQHFRVEQDQGVMVVTPIGPRLPQEHKDELYALVARLAREAGPRRAVLSLAGVRTLDSAGIGILINFQRRVRDAGGALRVCDLEPNVVDVIRLTRVDQVLDLSQTRAEAVAAFQAPPAPEEGKGSWFGKFFGGSS